MDWCILTNLKDNIMQKTQFKQAYHAIRAAKLYPTIGRFAAMRYCQKRNVPLRLYYLARMLEAANHAGL